MPGEAGVLGQPDLDVGLLVRLVVVEDQMNLPALRDLAVDRAQEREELGVMVAWQALVDHRRWCPTTAARNAWPAALKG